MYNSLNYFILEIIISIVILVFFLHYAIFEIKNQ
jgi:hypothetical protein